MEYNYKYQESKEINNITRPEDIKDIPKYAELKTKEQKDMILTILGMDQF